MQPRRLIVAITGASGSIYGVRLLEMLQGTGIETHLVMSRWGARTLVHETNYTPERVQRLATVNHPLTDQGAAISSGSFITMGMVIAPCSVRTLAAIAHGLGDHLVHRAADVFLKENRPLILVPRETPFNAIHLENMLKLARMGARIVPAMPSFYYQPQTIDDLVDHFTHRLLDYLGIEHQQETRWEGSRRKTAEVAEFKTQKSRKVE